MFYSLCFMMVAVYIKLMVIVVQLQYAPRLGSQESFTQLASKLVIKDLLPKTGWNKLVFNGQNTSLMSKLQNLQLQLVE